MANPDLPVKRFDPVRITEMSPKQNTNGPNGMPMERNEAAPTETKTPAMKDLEKNCRFNVKGV